MKQGNKATGQAWVTTQVVKLATPKRVYEVRGYIVKAVCSHITTLKDELAYYSARMHG